MSLTSRSVVTVDDLSNEEIAAVFSLADEFAQDVRAWNHVCRGIVIASLFYEPSTRTRLSFEAAVHRLGGDAVTSVDISASSLSKGETLADTARIIGSYVDLIVIRHPWEGAARVFADYAGVPVINAGDGGHEHPTQTLCDLYTLRKERGGIAGLKIAICGDLKHGRTVHSLAYALARFDAQILLYPAPGLGLPDYASSKMTTEYRGIFQPVNGEDLPGISRALGPDWVLDAIYVTPSKPNQPALFPGAQLNLNVVLSSWGQFSVDALYMTRLQKERLAPDDVGGKRYLVVDKDLMRGKEFKRTLVMHPLPRVDELSRELDTDPRSMYFRQAANGVPVRMALLALVAGRRGAGLALASPEPEAREAYCSNLGLRCNNDRCVTAHETSLASRFLVVGHDPVRLRCVFCEHEDAPALVGSAASRLARPASKAAVRRIKAENRVYFMSAEQAEQRQFRLHGAD